MKIGVIGCGHVGLVTAAVLAENGHTVAAYDVDPGRRGVIRQGVMPFYEAGLDVLVDACRANESLAIVDDCCDAVAGRNVVFLCVGTPPRENGEANLSVLEVAFREVVKCATGDLVVVEKSTVPAGTWERLDAIASGMRPELNIEVVSNPEFLREGSALDDARHPKRIVVGSSSAEALEVMREVYATQARMLVETNVASAEMAKHASNAFLATKISFANALADLCERVGADVRDVTHIMGMDPRIGREFLEAGLGFGGYCLPKDLDSFRALAAGSSFERFLTEVDVLNGAAIDRVVFKLRRALWNLDDKRIALLGLAFKPGTDDMRLSQSVVLRKALARHGADVVAHDPVAGVSHDDALDVLRGADALVLCTAWPYYLSLDPLVVREVMAGRVVVDARNYLVESDWIDAGFEYIGVGR